MATYVQNNQTGQISSDPYAIFLLRNNPGWTYVSDDTVVGSAPDDIRRWRPFTTYYLDEVILNPSSAFVSAKTTFTTGATYDATKWNTVAIGGPGGTVSKAAVIATGVVATDLGGALDLPDATVAASTATLDANKNSNVTASGGTYTAPAPAGTLGTPPLRFAVTNMHATASQTLTFPRASDGNTVNLTILPGEVVTFRQKTTQGYSAESGNKPLAQLDKRYLDGPTFTSPPLIGANPLAEYIQDTVAGLLVQGTGISLTYDDSGNTLTIGNTGSGGGLDAGTQYLSIKSYGAVGDGVTENYTAIRAAVTAAINLASSSGFPTAVYIPSGTYKVTMPDNGGDFLTWASKVSMIGAGRAVSRIVMGQSGTATDTPNFVKGTGANVNNPYTGCHFRNFEIDMTGTFSPASYTPTKGKAFYMQYNKNCSWSDLFVHGSKATGIGVDFLVDCHIQNNIIDSCGNFVAAQGTGDSGIGIGSGQSADEYAVITGNIVTNCRNYGIFTEKQGSGAVYWSRGFLVASNSCRGNRIGIADTGAQGTIVMGNQVNDNTAAGISVGQSAIGSGQNDGRETLIYGNMVLRNGGTGIGANNAIYTGRVTIRGNRSAYNTGAGIAGNFGSATTSAANPAAAYSVIDNDVHNNGSNGLDFGPTTNSGYVRDLILERNRVYNNTGSGLRLKLNITRLRLVGNVFWDDQTARTVTDGVTNSTTTLTSATAAFSLYDVGKTVTGAGIPSGTIITTYTSATSVVLSQAATASASGVSVTIGTAATQTTGMSIVTGVTVTDGVVTGNDARGCATPYAVTLSVFAGNLVLEGNPGLTGGGQTAVTVGASPFTYTAGRTPEDVYIDGGTVTNIKKGTTTVYSATGRMVRLGPGEALTVTYDSAPTMVADKR